MRAALAHAAPPRRSSTPGSPRTHGVELGDPDRRQHRLGAGDAGRRARRGDGDRRRRQRRRPAAEPPPSRAQVLVGRAHRAGRARRSRFDRPRRRSSSRASASRSARSPSRVSRRRRPAASPTCARRWSGATPSSTVLESVLERSTAEGHPHLVTVYGEPGVGKSRLAARAGRAGCGWRSRRRWSCRPLPAVRRRRHLLAARRDPQGSRAGARQRPARRRGRAASVPPSPTCSTGRRRPPTAVETAASLAYTLGPDRPGPAAADVRPAAVRRRPARGMAHVLLRAGRARTGASSSSRTSTGPTPRCSTCSRRWRSRSRGRSLFVCPSRPDLVGGPADLGRRPAQRRLGRPRPAGRRRGRRARTPPARRRRPAAVGARADPRARRGQPVLHRGDPAPAHRRGPGRLRRRALARPAATSDRVEIPDTVQGVLAARIDLLDAADKRVLQAAAVVGRIFWTEPVHLLAGNGGRPGRRARPAGGARPRAVPARLVARRPGRVHLQAHPHPRRRVRRHPPARAAARRMPSSRTGSSARRATGPASSPTCSRTTTPRPSSSVARPAARSTRSCARPRGPG